MCFRPTQITMKKCPQCGANNKPVATECFKCGAPLEDMKVDFDADQASLDAANMMPGMGGMPGMPMAPGMGGMPAMPQMPTAPSSPSAPAAPAAPTPPSTPGD